MIVRAEHYQSFEKKNEDRFSEGRTPFAETVIKGISFGVKN